MKSNACFVDTVCWIALLNQHDQLHKTADALYKQLMKSDTHFVTTSHVLDETANALSNPEVPEGNHELVIGIMPGDPAEQFELAVGLQEDVFGIFFYGCSNRR